MRTVFIVSIIFLVGFLFIPIASLNERAIVLLPLFTEHLADQNVWQWQNTAAFVMTYSISIILLIYFEISEKKPGIIISMVMNIVSALLIFAIVWMTQAGLTADLSFTYGYGWIFWLMGLILFLIVRIKKPAAV